MTNLDGEVANLLPTCWQQVVVMEFRKRQDTTDTTDFCPRQLVTDLLRTCCGESGVMDFGLRRSKITHQNIEYRIKI